jgi:hypothetical protein
LERTAVTEAAAELGSSVAAFRWLEGRGVDDKCLENFVRLCGAVALLGRGWGTAEQWDGDEAELWRRRNGGVLVGRRLQWRKKKMAGAMSFRE